MTTRRGVSWAGAVGAAVLLLTACGGDRQDEDTRDGADQVDEADAGDAGEPGPDPEDGRSADEGAADGEPVFDFPDNFEVVIDDDFTGDEETDELLRDHAYALKALRESYVQQKGTENFSRYWVAPVDSGYLEEFDRFAEKEWTMAGTDHYYAREVVTLGARQATIEFCEDTTAAWGEEIPTGERVESDNPGDVTGFREHVYSLERGDGGEWQVVNTYGIGNSQKCEEMLE